jgi:hypothetical protein
MTNTAPTTLTAIQAASQATFTIAQLLFYALYSVLVIGGNAKNRQITLLSQCEHAFTGRNMLMT